MITKSNPFLRNDYYPDQNDIDDLNTRINEVQSDVDLLAISVNEKTEAVNGRLNTLQNDYNESFETDSLKANTADINVLNVNVQAVIKDLNVIDTYTENLIVNKPVQDISLRTPHLENATSLNGNFYEPRIVGCELYNVICPDLLNIKPRVSTKAVGYDAKSGRLVPINASYDVLFTEDSDYIKTDDQGVPIQGISESEVVQSTNLIQAGAVQNMYDAVNANFNNVQNTFNNTIDNVQNTFNNTIDNVQNTFNNTIDNTVNDINNKIETEISKLSENFNTDNLSANNIATNNLDISDITIEKTTGDNGQVIGKTNGKVKWVNASDLVPKDILNIIWPIGVVYTQYPQQKSPQEIFPNTTWEELKYDGAFFRASGGNAADFIEESGVLSKQEQSILRHSHTGTTATDGAHAHSITVKTPSGTTSIGKVTAGTNVNCLTSTSSASTSTSSNGAHSHSFTTDSTGGDENRPDNFTIRIWKRTA